MARRGLPSFVGRKTYLYEKVSWQGATLKTLLHPTAYRL